VDKIGVCDMCGSENRLFKAEVEGTLLNVCKYCAKYGKIVADVHDKKFIEKIQRQKFRRVHHRMPEITEELIENYSEIIKKKREHLNLKQEDVAKKINEKLSLIHKVESGHFEPSIKLAKKLERFLRIKILEQVKDDSSTPQAIKSDSFTLGDFITVRKR